MINTAMDSMRRGRTGPGALHDQRAARQDVLPCGPGRAFEGAKAWIRFAPVLACLLLALAPSAKAFPNEPRGFGKAKFGMSVAEVRKLYPKMQVLRGIIRAAAVGGPHVKRFVLVKQPVPTVPKPAVVELRFWDDQFWVYIVYFDKEDTNGVISALESRYGKIPPGGAPIWSGKRSQIVLDRKLAWYSVSDNAISKTAQKIVMDAYRRARARYRAQHRAAGRTQRPEPRARGTPER